MSGSPAGGEAAGMPSRHLLAALAALLVIAPSAAAKTDGAPLRLWTVSRIDRGGGIVPVSSGAQLGGVLDEKVKLGVGAFSFGGPFLNHADGDVFSSADGSTYSVRRRPPRTTRRTPAAQRAASRTWTSSRPTARRPATRR